MRIFSLSVATWQRELAPRHSAHRGLPSSTNTGTEVSFFFREAKRILQICWARFFFTLRLSSTFFDLLVLFRFPFSDTDSPTPMDCCYWLNGAHSKARSLVLSIPTFELSFGCLIVCDSFLIHSSLYPLVFLLLSYFPLRARLRIYFCRRFITFAESRGAGCDCSIHFTWRNKKSRLLPRRSKFRLLPRRSKSRLARTTHTFRPASVGLIGILVKRK